MELFDRLSEGAKRAVARAQVEMERWHHSHVGPEHLLAAIVGDRESVAGVLLARLGATEEIRQRLESALTAIGSLESGQGLPSPPVKRVIAISFQQADKVGKGTVSTGDLLVAFLIARGMTAEILTESGVDLRVVLKSMPTVHAPREWTRET